MNAAARVAALEAELAAARRQLASERLDAAPQRPRAVFDAATAPLADPHWQSRWAGWQRFAASPSPVLIAQRPNWSYSPGHIPLEVAEAIDKTPYRLGPDAALATVAKVGQRVTAAGHQVADLVAAGWARVAEDQSKPPDAIVWARPLPGVHKTEARP